MHSRKDVGTTTGTGKVEQTEVKAFRTLTEFGAINMQFSWLEIAQKELNVSEVPGARNNPRIVEYHKTTTLQANEDSVPWCSSFVNWCIEKAGYKGTDSARALSWKSWGVEAESFIPVGSIVVMKRKGGGHVGFKVGEDVNSIFVLGGNQSDAVNVRAFARTQVVAFRLPTELNDNDDTVYEYLLRHGV